MNFPTTEEEEEHLDDECCLTSASADLKDVSLDCVAAVRSGDYLTLNLKVSGIYGMACSSDEDDRRSSAVFWACLYSNKEIVTYFNSMGANIDFEDTRTWGCLRVAVRKGDADAVRFLLCMGVPVDAGETNNFYAIHSAAEMGHADVVKALLDRDSSLSTKLHYERTPLMFACMTGHLNVVRVIAESHFHSKAIPSATDQLNRSPCLIAAQNSHLDVLKYLILKGCRLDVTDSDGLGLVHLAVSRGTEEVSLSLLEIVGFRCNVNVFTNTNMTPLMFACQLGYTRVVKKLLFTYGARVDYADKSGNKAVYYVPEHAKDLLSCLLEVELNSRTKYVMI